jgi:hypothetical protein
VTLNSLFGHVEASLAAGREKWERREREEAPHFEANSFFLKREVVDSRVLAALLSPTAAHGQGTTFLRLFLHNLKIDPDHLDLQRTRVDCECGFLDEEGKCRWIDVLVTLSDRSVIAIENKSRGAGDQPNQVEAYLRWLKRNYPDQFTFVYLSNQPPDSVSKDEWDGYGKRARWLLISDLSDWLVEWGEAAKARKVQDFLMGFSNHLRGGTLANNGDFFESGDAQALIVAESTQPEVLTAAAAILFHRYAIWLALWTQFMKTLEGLVLNGLESENAGWKVSIDEWRGAESEVWWYSFNLTCPSWRDAVYISFETGPENDWQMCQLGIRSIPLPKEKTAEETDLARSLQRSLGKSESSNWMWRKRIPELTDMRVPSQLILTQNVKEVSRIAEKVRDLAIQAKPVIDDWVQSRSVKGRA